VSKVWQPVSGPEYSKAVVARISNLRSLSMSSFQGAAHDEPNCKTSDTAIVVDASPAPPAPGTQPTAQPPFTFVSHATNTYFTNPDVSIDCTGSQTPDDDTNTFDRPATLTAQLGHLRPDTHLQISTADHAPDDLANRAKNLQVDYSSAQDGISDPLELTSTAMRIGELHTEVDDLPAHATVCFDSGSAACGDPSFPGGTVSFRADMHGTLTRVGQLWMCQPNSDDRDDSDDFPPLAIDCNRAPEGEDGGDHHLNGLNVRNLALAKLQMQIQLPSLSFPAGAVGIDTDDQETWGDFDYYPDGTPVDDASLRLGGVRPDPQHPGQVLSGPGLTHGFLANDRRIFFSAAFSPIGFWGHIACGRPLGDGAYEWLRSAVDSDFGGLALSERLCNYDGDDQTEVTN
jgi:hypothetical protein